MKVCKHTVREYQEIIRSGHYYYAKCLACGEVGPLAKTKKLARETLTTEAKFNKRRNIRKSEYL